MISLCAEVLTVHVLLVLSSGLSYICCVCLVKYEPLDFTV